MRVSSRQAKATAASTSTHQISCSMMGSSRMGTKREARQRQMLTVTHCTAMVLMDRPTAPRCRPPYASGASRNQAVVMP